MNKTGKNRRQQLGQSMVEYTIVIAFGILTMSRAPMKDAVASLLDTIRQNYAGYSFALSLSDYPDSDTASNYWDMLDGPEFNVNDDMKDVLTDKTKQFSNRTSARYTTAVAYYQTSSPDSLSGQQAVKSRIPDEARILKNLSIP
jgi:hypothetical protein